MASACRADHRGFESRRERGSPLEDYGGTIRMRGRRQPICFGSRGHRVRLAGIRPPDHHARMTRNDARDDPCPTTRTVYARRMTATRTATVEFTGLRPAIETITWGQRAIWTAIERISPNDAYFNFVKTL